MSLNRSRIWKMAAPWVIGLPVLGGAFWMWDLKDYPVSKVFDPAHSPPPKWSPPQRLIGFLREAKEERFWKGFALKGTTWRATHLFVSTTSTVRFTESRVFVDPPDLKVGVPFVHDSEYRLTSTRRIESMAPRNLGNGEWVARKMRGVFAKSGTDLTEVLLVLGPDHVFVLKRIQQGQIDDPTGFRQSPAE